MIDTQSLASDQLNSYNIAQLQFAFGDPKAGSLSPYINLSPSGSPQIIATDIEYDSRRMSSSENSAADTDGSGLSPADKMGCTPSPQLKQRPTVSIEAGPWDAEQSSGQPSEDSANPFDHDSKVQLPSILTTFENNYRPEYRRSSMPNIHERSTARLRHAPYPPTNLRMGYTPSSGLSSYQFPPSSSDTNFESLSTPSTTLSAAGLITPISPDFHRPQNMYPDLDNWSPTSGIPRPNSTPGDMSGLESPTMRNASFGSPTSTAPMFAGNRISGQERRSFSHGGLKTDWSFPTSEFLLPSSTPTYSSSPSMAPSISSLATGNSPARAAATAAAASNSESTGDNSLSGSPTSTSAERPPPAQRKRGKLPKETTDFLKSWLHRHSDHPYPSEEEKKQLCQATGLNMSQVSNWMINARRRILAPAHRAASASASFANARQVLDGRRASLPTSSLQIYPPMSLQSIHHPLDYSHQRHMMPHVRTQLQGPGGMDYGHRMMNRGPQSAGGPMSNHFVPMVPSVPSNSGMSSAPSSAHPFSQHAQQQQNMNMYGSYEPRLSLPDTHAFFNSGHPHGEHTYSTSQ